MLFKINKLYRYLRVSLNNDVIIALKSIQIGHKKKGHKHLSRVPIQIVVEKSNMCEKKNL